MNIIIDPTNHKQYSLFSNKGKNILKSYIKYFNGGTNFTQYPNLRKIQDIPGLLRDNVSDKLNTKSTTNYVATEKRAVNDINWESRLGMSIEDAFKDYLVPITQHDNIKAIIEETIAENPVATCARITNEKQRRACITFYKVKEAKKKMFQKKAIEYMRKEGDKWYDDNGWDFHIPKYVTNNISLLEKMLEKNEIVPDIRLIEILDEADRQLDIRKSHGWRTKSEFRDLLKRHTA